MFTKSLVFCSALAVLSIATESLADTVEVIEIDPRTFQQQNRQCQQYANYYNNYYNQYYKKYYNDYYYNYYKQHSNLQPQIPNINIGNAKVEWVCTNPKTKDTMIIGSEEVPANGHYHPSPNYPQRPNYPPQRPQYPPQQQPNYPPQRPQYPPQQQPNYPPAKPSFPTDPNPQQNPNNQQNQPGQTEQPNTNGEGVIDIRFGEE